MQVRKWGLFAVLCLGAPLSMRAVTLASYGAAGAANVAPNYLGEMFTTGGSGAYNGIAFDFVTVGGSAYAIGTGFLLTQQYLGVPGSLSSTTAGFLGSAVASGGFYSFGSGVTLQSGTTYYLYENALAPTTTVAGGITGSPGVEFYFATSTGNFTGQPGASAAFAVTGNSVSASAVPEPSSFALLGAGLLGVAGAWRRRMGS